MFRRLRLRLGDMKTLSNLISGADDEALANGEDKPGAEHFVLSALRMKDGSARRVFEKLDLDARRFREAIRQQYAQALDTLGIKLDDEELTPVPLESAGRIPDAQPSGTALIHSLYELKKNDKEQPLRAAHVLSVAADMERGVVARALTSLGVDRKHLAQLVQEELRAIVV